MLELIAIFLLILVSLLIWQFLRGHKKIITQGVKITASRYGLEEEEVHYELPDSQSTRVLAEFRAPYALFLERVRGRLGIAAGVVIAAAAGFSVSQYAFAPNADVSDAGSVEAKFASGLSVGYQAVGRDAVDRVISQIKDQKDDIQYLRVEDVQLSDLGIIGNLKYLKSLNLDGTLVDDLTPIRHLKTLTALDLGRTPFYDASQLAYFPDLRWLDLSETKVFDFAPLSEIITLQSLDLENVEIDDLAPLSELANLRRLNLAQTSVANLEPLSELAKLEELDLGWTKVHDLEPLHGLTSLRMLDLSKTPVAPDQIERLQRRLAEMGNSDLEIRISPGWGAEERDPTS